MKNKKLFIATPISAFQTNREYKSFRKWIQNLIVILDDSTSFKSIFCVADLVKSTNALDNPKSSLISDLNELDNASHFLFIYANETPTSALMELGYALAKNKSITIVHPKDIKLPFMAKDLDKIYLNVRKHKITKFNNKSLMSILDLYL